MLLQVLTYVILAATPADETSTEEAVMQTTANPAIKQAYADTPEGQVHYWHAGTGPVLLMVHQSSSSAEEYAGLVPHLADRYRLVAFDWPGHGMSDDPSKELGVPEYTASALAVLDDLGASSFHVLGHHGGALIAMNLAWKHPDRVQKIVLSGTSGVREASETKAFTESLDLEKRNHVDREGQSLSGGWSRYLKYMPHSSPEEILRAYVINLGAKLRPYDAHYGVLRWDRRPALSSLSDRKVLLLQGENDEFVSHQENLLERLPQAKRVVIENAGTFMFFEKPEEIAAVISRFLAEG